MIVGILLGFAPQSFASDLLQGPYLLQKICFHVSAVVHHHSLLEIWVGRECKSVFQASDLVGKKDLWIRFVDKPLFYRYHSINWRKLNLLRDQVV